MAKLVSGSGTISGVATQAEIDLKANLASPAFSGTPTGIVRGSLETDIIDGTKLADNAIDSEHYTDGSIDLAHMSADSVDSDQYVDASIDTAHIGNLQVTTGKIAADAIDGTKIADDAIDSEHYTDGSIDSAHIGNDQIDSQHYAAGSIDLEHMSSESVDEDNLHISNAGSNGQFLSKQSGNAGGLTWAAAGGSGKVLQCVDFTLASNDTNGMPTVVSSAWEAFGTSPTFEKSITITAGSDIMCWAMLSLSMKPASGIRVRFYDETDSEIIGNPGANGLFGTYIADDSQWLNVCGMARYDDPGAGAHNIQIQVYGPGSGSGYGIYMNNRAYGDTIVGLYSSSIVLMEIAA